MDGYKLLAAAIVERAVLDYKEALKSKDNYETYLLERFFSSSWFQSLAEADGKVLMKKIKAMEVTL